METQQIQKEVADTKQKVSALSDRKKNLSKLMVSCENEIEILNRSQEVLTQAIADLESAVLYGKLDSVVCYLKKQLINVEQEIKDFQADVDEMIVAKNKVELDYEGYVKEMEKLGYTEQQIREAEQLDMLEVSRW